MISYEGMVVNLAKRGYCIDRACAHACARARAYVRACVRA